MSADVQINDSVIYNAYGPNMGYRGLVIDVDYGNPYPVAYVSFDFKPSEGGPVPIQPFRMWVDVRHLVKVSRITKKLGI